MPKDDVFTIVTMVIHSQKRFADICDVHIPKICVMLYRMSKNLELNCFAPSILSMITTPLALGPRCPLIFSSIIISS